MIETRFDIAKRDYNKIVNKLGLEYLQVGTRFTENKNSKYWNLRDLVAELDYQLSTYREFGHANYEELHSSDRYDRLQAMRECRMLKDFINRYESYVSRLHCYEGHCSRFDN